MKKYSTIIADPPWTYDQSCVRGAAAKQYETMSLEALCALPVDKLAAENSILLLWATWPKLDEACLPLMKAWCFEYITGFPWIKITDIGRTFTDEIEIKVPYGIGYWVRGCSELVLIGKRGNTNPPDRGFIGLLSPNLYHSRKPDDLYEYAETLPGPYLELFARKRRAGWDSVGFGVDGIGILESLKLLGY